MRPRNARILRLSFIVRYHSARCHSGRREVLHPFLPIWEAQKTSITLPEICATAGDGSSDRTQAATPRAVYRPRESLSRRWIDSDEWPRSRGQLLMELRPTQSVHLSLSESEVVPVSKSG